MSPRAGPFRTWLSRSTKDEPHLVTEKDVKLFVRPVRPEDEPVFQHFFKALSPTTIYNRFFTHVKELSPEMLARFTQIDYDREIALVALDDNPEAERMLGVARIAGDPDGKNGEFAVVVGDPWQWERDRFQSSPKLPVDR